MGALGYRFRDARWLEEALTHPSCNLKREDGTPLSYQRLEFLGDGILGAVIGELLFAQFPQEAEGDLARRKAALVNKEAVAQVVRDLGLEAQIRFSPTEAAAGGAENVSVQEDVGEALIGAIFMDGGFAAARQFIITQWGEKLTQTRSAPIDAKTALQEWAQAQGHGLPEYVLVQQEGPAHAPIFTIEVRVEGCPPQQAIAPNKRRAEQDAAARMLEVVNGK